MAAKIFPVCDMSFSQLLRQQIFYHQTSQAVRIVTEHALTNRICQEDLALLVDHDDGLNRTLKNLPERFIRGKRHHRDLKRQYKEDLTKISFFVDPSP